MAGFLLGAGSGVLAGAAVYYTMSTGIQQSTAQLQADLARSQALLERAYNESPQPAPSTRYGPSYPSQPSFGDLVKQRWNAALSAAVSDVRDADWSGLTQSAIRKTQQLAHSASDSVKAFDNNPNPNIDPGQLPPGDDALSPAATDDALNIYDRRHPNHPRSRWLSVDPGLLAPNEDAVAFTATDDILHVDRPARPTPNFNEMFKSIQRALTPEAKELKQDSRDVTAPSKVGPINPGAPDVDRKPQPSPTHVQMQRETLWVDPGTVPPVGDAIAAMAADDVFTADETRHVHRPAKTHYVDPGTVPISVDSMSAYAADEYMKIWEATHVDRKLQASSPAPEINAAKAAHAVKTGAAAAVGVDLNDVDRPLKPTQPEVSPKRMV